MERAELLRRLGGMHGVNGDGAATLRAIVRTCEEMLRDRGARRSSTPTTTTSTPVARVAPGRVGRRGRGPRRITTREPCRAHHGRRSIPSTVRHPSRVGEQAHPIQFFRAIDVCVAQLALLVPRHALDGGPSTRRRRRGAAQDLDTDRVVQYYDWPCGTIVRIRRVFGGHEPIDYLRIVTAAR